MKKALLTLFLSAAVTTTFAQTTNTFPATGNAGIGTTSPGNLLTVSGNNNNASPGNTATFSSNIGSGTVLGNQLNITSTTATWGLLAGWDGSGVATTAYHGANAGYLVNVQSGPLFLGTSNLSRMTITSGGNIGIGTSTPTYLLSVGGNASSVTGGQSSIQYLPAATSGNYAGHVSQLIANPSTNSAAIYYSVLGEAGDNSGVASNFTNSTSIIGVAGSIVHRGTGNINSAISLMAANNVITNGGTINNAYGLYVATIKATGITNSYGVYQYSASDPNYFAGNVGIGTVDNASWTLATSTYKLAVNGSAIATSMVVKLQANWPDYVFKNGYHLPSLSDVKAYIDQNHHLPDMPSEQEVTDKGLNLGEINKQLTKKVEELTLYLIEQNKQLGEQKKVIQSLQEQIDKLSEAIKNQSTK
jgi:hypothetical protein